MGQTVIRPGMTLGECRVAQQQANRSHASAPSLRMPDGYQRKPRLKPATFAAQVTMPASASDLQSQRRRLAEKMELVGQYQSACVKLGQVTGKQNRRLQRAMVTLGPDGLQSTLKGFAPEVEAIGATDFRKTVAAAPGFQRRVKALDELERAMRA